MSNSGDEDQVPDRAALQALERAVGQALDRLEALRLRAEAAEAKAHDLEALLARFTEDGDSAGRMIERMKALERENADLRRRLDQGRDGVDRILARIRFLEDQR